MKVTFGMELDGYESPGPTNTIGEVTVGPLGFLGILETQLGLVGNWPNEAIRVVQYLHCLKSLDNGDRFYSRSLANDELAVARTLLNWRDTWIEAGWDGSASPTDSKRLVDLAEAEKASRDKLSPGVADRSRCVLNALSKRDSLGITVDVTEEISNLPFVWQEILSLLDVKENNSYKSKVIIAEDGSDLALLQNIIINNQKAEFKGDGSVVFLTAHSEEVLARCLAQMVDESPDCMQGSWFCERLRTSILTGRKSDILDIILSGLDLPRSGSSSPSRWRPHLQVLPLSISLLWEPLDPYRLLEFLSNPVCPLPAFARYRLAEIVAQCPGIEGEEWNRTVTELQDKYSQQKILSELIDQWLKPDRYDPEEGAPVNVAAERCQQVARWSAAQASLPDLKPGIKELFYAASSQSGTAAKLLDEMRKGGVETIKRLQLDRLLDQATSRGVSISENFAECGHVHIVNSPSAMIDKNERVVWWNFVEPHIPSKWPWSPLEIEQMQAHGISLPAVDSLLQQQAESWHRPILSATRQIVFMVPGTKGNDAIRKHPIWDLIESKAGKTLPLIDIDDALSAKAMLSDLSLNLDSLPRKDLPAPVRWWTIDEEKQLLVSREKESFSSLDAFIKSPYQWVLRYKARLRPGSLVQVEDDNRQKGNLLHHLTELLFQSGEVNWQTASEIEVKTWVDKTFADLFYKEGANYLLAGKSAEREKLLEIARHASWVLIQHLRVADIQEVEMEKWVDGRFIGGDITGAIDMLVKNRQGKEAVIDLKWSGGKYRRDELENNNHLQLAVYAVMRKEATGKWPEHAYFILSEARLLAQDNSFFTDAEICKAADGEDTNTLWESFEKTWKWRRDQLDEGLIELTVEGTTADENSMPPPDAIPIDEHNDKFNDFGALTGWTEEL